MGLDCGADERDATMTLSKWIKSRDRGTRAILRALPRPLRRLLANDWRSDEETVFYACVFDKYGRGAVLLPGMNVLARRLVNVRSLLESDEAKMRAYEAQWQRTMKRRERGEI